MSLKVAIIGAGPAGYYTAEGVLKLVPDAQIDMIDRLPTPYGLIRAGVAPDHQSIKAVTKRFEATHGDGDVGYVGHVSVGSDVSIDELRSLYHAVVLATGAPRDRRLGIPGDDLPGVIGAAAFVGWYNGHPDFADLDISLRHTHVAVIGNGNVAIDVARVLAKTPEEMTSSDLVIHAAKRIHASDIINIGIYGRRGPHQVSFTPKELGEMGELKRATAIVDPAQLPDVATDAALEPGLRKAVGHLRHFAARTADTTPVTIRFEFFARPVAIYGDKRVEGIRFMRTHCVDGKAVETGETFDRPCGLVVPCIGYVTPPIPGVPYDENQGRFANDDGLVIPPQDVLGGLYCVGWSRRGPTGTIGTNRPDGFHIAERLLATAPQEARSGRAGLRALLAARDHRAVDFAAWKNIEAREIANARPGAPREKYVHTDEMLTAAARPDG